MWGAGLASNGPKNPESSSSNNPAATLDALARLGVTARLQEDVESDVLKSIDGKLKSGVFTSANLSTINDVLSGIVIKLKSVKEELKQLTFGDNEEDNEEIGLHMKVLSIRRDKLRLKKNLLKRLQNDRQANSIANPNNRRNQSRIAANNVLASLGRSGSGGKTSTREQNEDEYDPFAVAEEDNIDFKQTEPKIQQKPRHHIHNHHQQRDSSAFRKKQAEDDKQLRAIMKERSGSLLFGGDRSFRPAKRGSLVSQPGVVNRPCGSNMMRLNGTSSLDRARQMQRDQHKEARRCPVCMLEFAEGTSERVMDKHIDKCYAGENIDTNNNNNNNNRTTTGSGSLGGFGRGGNSRPILGSSTLKKRSLSRSSRSTSLKKRKAPSSNRITSKPVTKSKSTPKQRIKKKKNIKINKVNDDDSDSASDFEDELHKDNKIDLKLNANGGIDSGEDDDDDDDDEDQMFSDDDDDISDIGDNGNGSGRLITEEEEEELFSDLEAQEEYENDYENDFNKRFDVNVTRDDCSEEVYGRRMTEFQEWVEQEEFECRRNGEQIQNAHIYSMTVPWYTWRRLFPYQQECVRWMANLRLQHAGGIVGDEMGLGKTVEVCGYFAGGHLDRILVVCPATTLGHWVKTCHEWCPELRVFLLHQSGTGSAIGLDRLEVLRAYFNHNGPRILVATYAQLRIHKVQLLRARFDCVVLDEGHLIKNSEASITKIAKQLQSYHRFILSGSPIQNKLRELWSLFDFVFPDRLGTQYVFEQQFSIPINLAARSNASSQQLETAYRCAVTLKTLIEPHMLRRLKKDLSDQLPKKTEQVLFCRLTSRQKEVYKRFLRHSNLQAVLDHRSSAFGAISLLRKICNHTDLLKLKNNTVEFLLPTELEKYRKEIAKQEKEDKKNKIKDEQMNNFDLDNMNNEIDMDDDNESEEEDGEVSENHIFGDEHLQPLDRLLAGSGKLLVLHEILKSWWEEGHKALIFCQTRQMLGVLEEFVRMMEYPFSRMDGNTSVAKRSHKIDEFNETEYTEKFLFLLTTKVGGIGVNLVGADRVLIFDPDWNPAVDTQARERAWRIGQKRDVLIYRLICKGTIEEQIYHRQIFKQHLVDKVLSDPHTVRAFKQRDLHRLFVFEDDGETVVPDIVQGVDQTDLEIYDQMVEKRRQNRRKKLSFKNTVEAETMGDEDNDENGSNDNNGDNDDNGMGGKCETKLLKSLFNGNQLSQMSDFESRMNEEMSLQRKIEIQTKAAKYARKAMRELEKSSAQKSAFANAPSAPRFGRKSAFGSIGTGSSSIISDATRSMSSGAMATASQNSSSQLLRNFAQMDPEAKKLEETVSLAEEIRDFFASCNGECPTNQLSRKFRKHLGNDGGKFYFRQVLRELATLRNGVWTLKDRF